MEPFDCPVCDWSLSARYYPARRYVELFCRHCHLAVRMGFDRHGRGWPVTVRRELAKVRERLWGVGSPPIECSTLPTLTNSGVAG